MARLAEFVDDLEDLDGVMSNESVELGPVFFDKKEYIVTKNGNKISKKALLAGSQKIQSNVQVSCVVDG